MPALSTDEAGAALWRGICGVEAITDLLDNGLKPGRNDMSYIDPEKLAGLLELIAAELRRADEILYGG